ncbi:hypothetical protein QO002_006278 [Pararhizobium capsulatum DSM 1112]|uniref:Transposase n=1 Tax=Pararhizobium capsulatum DSM 1112 TaxID=1121113 RepID=A0ABU0C0L7_9HYPH|nr:hypothetical protein [Pararhizobium capsulatum]MDQ0323472.1 hypothetical protein [Pararhizobium capsulatum DSM 1112]MDQ0324071.1 hypothetical protein [Pararhizobium capsulatum DSM 1112]
MSATLSWIAENNRRWVGMLGRHPVATIIQLQEPQGQWLWSENLTKLGGFQRSHSFTDAQKAAEGNVRAWLEGAGLPTASG